MKLLVIGGTHGNERLGIELVKLIESAPLAGVSTLLANPRAIAKGQRFTETDLNRSFGGGTSYEASRAQDIIEVAPKYDIVLDFHNTQTPGNNCSFVGEGCRKELYAAASAFGMVRCIVATTYDCINMYCKNAISIEISIGDILDDPSYWYERIAAFVAGELKPQEDIELYRFLRRVTWQEKTDFDLRDWQPFQPITEKDKRKLKVSGIVVPIFVGSRLTDYYATLLERSVS